MLSHDLQHNAAACGEIIISGLKEAAAALSTVGEVRGRGLMFAVDLVDPATKQPSPPLAGKALEAARERGLLIGKGGLFGATLRMAPPLTLSEAEAREGLGLLTDALRAVDAEAAKVVKHVTHWIGGKPWTAGAERHGDVYDPATGQVSGHVDFATADDVDAAVRAAAEAFASWRRVSLARRASIMFAFRELIREHTAELAALITAEHGKVAADAAGEVARGLEVVEFACGIPHLLKGGYSENVSTGVDSYSIRQPLGVVAGITPFNFPAMVPMWMFPLAIACGNTFVLKPSEKDPSASLLLARLWAQAGLPDGVFNVVHGDKVAVDALLTHPDIAAVSFVGSTPIARYVYETGTSHGKRVQALGGAKNHMVVLPDADLDLAADAAVSAGFGSAGERCMAISALVAVDPIGDELLAKIKDRVGKLIVGPGADERSEMGPLVTGPHRDKVASYLDSGVAQGASLPIDGRRHPVTGGDAGGFWLGPERARPRDPGDELLHRRDLRPGAVDAARADRTRRRSAWSTTARTATAWRSSPATGERPAGSSPRRRSAWWASTCRSRCRWRTTRSAGGRPSLFGDTHVHGTEGVHFYTHGKVVTSRWPDPSHGGVNLGFPVNSYQRRRRLDGRRRGGSSSARPRSVAWYSTVRPVRVRSASPARCRTDRCCDTAPGVTPKPRASAVVVAGERSALSSRARTVPSSSAVAAPRQGPALYPRCPPCRRRRTTRWRRRAPGSAAWSACWSASAPTRRASRTRSA